MMEYGDHQELIAENAIHHRERKPAKQHPAAVADDEREHFGIACSGSNGGVQSACEFNTETRRTRFVPGLRGKRFVSGLGPKKNPHSVIALKQFGADLIPRQSARRVLRMLFQPGLNRLKLVGRQSHGFRALCGDAVPNIFRELDTLSDGQVEKIGSGLAHGGNIDRWRREGECLNETDP